ncbi:hypothetical protein Hypma_007286 [Hypsizygus marmoreus]|uniref:Uncharacterized protein n=1 Tax=Hypsizygus marmoreus TaxID=39966 RepID=A0A369K7E5_HYPMA|nr:hypothetical protein Hypma_007286 [Hypsizygus marmoreus]
MNTIKPLAYVPQLRSKTVPLEILGYPITRKWLLAHAVEHSIFPDNCSSSRRSAARELLRQELPLGPARNVSFAVPFECEEEGNKATCWIIGSNNSPEDLKRALDPVRVEEYRKVLNMKEPPKWYSKGEYESFVF